MGTVWKVVFLVAMVFALAATALPTSGVIQKRSDVPPAAAAAGAVESSASSEGAAEGSINNEIPPNTNPALQSLFDDIFNIPIQVLRAVNRLLTNPGNTIGQSTQVKPT